MVVVGMGPVGAAVALLLSATGVRTVVLERESHPHGEGRAVALDDTALRVLQAAGLGPLLRGLLEPARSVRFVSGTGRALLELTPGISAYGHPELSFFNQPDLELRPARGTRPGAGSGAQAWPRRARRRTSRASAVEVTALDRAGGRRVRLDAAVVLGCDGARSTVRSAIGARLRGLSSPRRWLVLDTRREGDPPGCFEFGCDPARPWVHGTLPGGRHRWEFLLAPEESAAELERPAAVARLLEQRGHAGAEVLRAAVYAHHARVAERLVRGRVMLLGDAAHLSPPFAGQGLSAGLRDAMAAAWRAAGVARGRFDPEVAGRLRHRAPPRRGARDRSGRGGGRGGPDARHAAGRGARRGPPGDARAARSRRAGCRAGDGGRRAAYRESALRSRLRTLPPPGRGPAASAARGRDSRTGRALPPRRRARPGLRADRLGRRSASRARLGARSEELGRLEATARDGRRRDCERRTGPRPSPGPRPRRVHARRQPASRPPGPPTRVVGRLAHAVSPARAPGPSGAGRSRSERGRSRVHALEDFAVATSLATVARVAGYAVSHA
ncbi:MAG: FAD-dependent monooxygenase [Thermoleophilaceae bacterium]